MFVAYNAGCSSTLAGPGLPSSDASNAICLSPLNKCSAAFNRGAGREKVNRKENGTNDSRVVKEMGEMEVRVWRWRLWQHS